MEDACMCSHYNHADISIAMELQMCSSFYAIGKQVK